MSKGLPKQCSSCGGMGCGSPCEYGLSERKKDKPKQSTKVCPECGNDKLILLYSMNKKICNNCGVEIPWYLDEGQKPLFR